MKAKSLFTRTVCAASLAAAMIAGTASANTVVAFDFDQGTRDQVYFRDLNLNVSTISLNGGLQYNNTTSANVKGWTPSTSINLDQSVTFDVTVASGYELSITGFFPLGGTRAGNFAVGTRLETGAWGYRINDGSGFGAWTLQSYTLGSLGSATTTFNFAEPLVISENDTIQFGFFAWGATTAGALGSYARGGTGDDMYITGTVSPAVAVPEPSTIVLASAGGLAMLGLIRRARSRKNA